MLDDEFGRQNGDLQRWTLGLATQNGEVRLWMMGLATQNGEVRLWMMGLATKMATFHVRCWVWPPKMVRFNFG